MTQWRLLALAIALLAGSTLGACDRRKPPAEAEPGPAAESTLNGLSREQIEERARAMSPERAESLGIIDTTIHVEDLSGDTLAPPPVDGITPEPVAP